MKFDKGLMAGGSTLMVLALLEKRDMYGYQMIEELARRSNDVFQMKEGTLYPILYRLEDDGLIQSTWQADGRAAPKKVYTPTPEGREELRRQQAVWKEFCACVARFEDGGDQR